MRIFLDIDDLGQQRMGVIHYINGTFGGHSIFPLPIGSDEKHIKELFQSIEIGFKNCFNRIDKDIKEFENQVKLESLKSAKTAIYTLEFQSLLNKRKNDKDE